MKTLLLAFPLTLAGCIQQLEPCPGTAPGPGASVSCSMPGFVDRAFDLEVPAAWDGKSPLPLLLAFHGGGGRRESAESVSCPGGDVDHAGCLGAVAGAKGFVVVRPDGVGTRPLRNLRTWNAGGGRDGWDCTSGPACKSGSDDVGYVRALLGQVRATVPIDPARIFATGISNGGAMSHRLACEMPETFAAIVSVGGGNQLSTLSSCAPGVAVMEVHGTEDPCWTYATSDASCLANDGQKKLGVAETMEGWATRNACAPTPVERALADVDPADGTTVRRFDWKSCRADVSLVRIEGGGHTWPGGYQYFGVDRVGRVTHDVGSDVIVEFFLAHPKP